MAETPQSLKKILAQSELIYSENDVEAAIDQIAAQITRDMQDSFPIVLTVMVGAVIFSGKLLGRLSFPLEIDYVHATRYGSKTQGGQLAWLVYPRLTLKDRDILILDDIFDEGLTLKAIVEHCYASGARSVKTAVLVDKHRQRAVDFIPDYIGLKVEDRYVFGYGMDYKGYLRNVMGIYAIQD